MINLGFIFKKTLAVKLIKHRRYSVLFSFINNFCNTLKKKNENLELETVS